MASEVILLGVAQDAGVPQIGCDCANCAAVRAGQTQASWPVALGLIDRAHQQFWLIDATPHFSAQYDALRQLAGGCQFAGLLLTHAHMGHYTGLIQLGREGMNSAAVPVYVSPRMADFLQRHAPWSQLVALQNIALQEISPDQRLALSPQLSVTPLAVPHRGEFTDTLAFLIHGPRRTLFYCPDIDRWELWRSDLREFLDRVELALVDGCFFSGEELPGRDLRLIPHPLVTDTVARAHGTSCALRFIHLNHTNPLLRSSPERRWVEEQGFGVAQQGERWELG